MLAPTCFQMPILRHLPQGGYTWVAFWMLRVGAGGGQPSLTSWGTGAASSAIASGPSPQGSAPAPSSLAQSRRENVGEPKEQAASHVVVTGACTGVGGRERGRERENENPREKKLSICFRFSSLEIKKMKMDRNIAPRFPSETIVHPIETCHLERAHLVSRSLVPIHGPSLVRSVSAGRVCSNSVKEQRGRAHTQTQAAATAV